MDLLTITKKRMPQMLESNEMDINDFLIFSENLQKYIDIEQMAARPHLVIIHGNIWEYFHEINNDVMEYLGYELVGRMQQDYRNNEDTFVFDYHDYDYDMLYRLKNPLKADYTKILRF